MKTVSKKLLSILLVAVLLISAVPFQAFATSDCADPDHVHTYYPKLNGTEHALKCDTCADDAWIAGSGEPHNFNKTGYDEDNHWVECSVCGYIKDDTKLPHQYGTTPTSTVPATCVAAGKNVYKCAGCDKTKEEPIAIDPDAHNIVGDNCTNPGCTYSTAGANPTSVTVTFHLMNGTSDTQTVTLTSGSQIGNKLPAAPTTYTGTDADIIEFKYWALGSVNGAKVEAGTTFTANADVYGVWVVPTYQLTIRRVLNGKNDSALTLDVRNVKKNTYLLSYLNETANGVKDLVKAAVPAGYSWEEGNYWKDFSGTQPLTSQSDKMDQAQTIFVNFTANKYKLYFNAGTGATCATTEKEVTYDEKVGTLPTPTKDGYVFIGWEDADGKLYTADTVYKVAGNTTLYAHFEKEALVLLRIYLNGDTSAPDRIVALDKYIVNNNVSREAVEKIVLSKYSAQSGKTLALDGLFTDATWNDYKANSSKAGTPNVQVTADHLTNVYVMVRNAQQGAASSNSSSSNKPADTTNPKTGDNAFIGAAATVMIASAAAYVSMTQLRKKKSI